MPSEFLLAVASHVIAEENLSIGHNACGKALIA